MNPTLGIPMGWYGVARSTDVARGRAAPLRSFGRDLVAYRGRDGRVRVLDAFCPHQGIHLGRGGEVVGDELRCRWHERVFSGDGACRSHPSTARLRAWETDERCGLIMVWFDQAGRPPSWRLDPLRELDDGTWSPLKFGATPLEISSAVALVHRDVTDVQHFDTVHGVRRPKAKIQPDGPRLTTLVSGTWDLRSYLGGAHHRLRSGIESLHEGLPGALRRIFDAAVRAQLGRFTIAHTLHGPGLSVAHLTLSAGALEARIFTTMAVNPIAHDQLRLHYGIAVKHTPIPGLSRLMRHLFVRQNATNLDYDRVKWESQLLSGIGLPGEGRQAGGRHRIYDTWFEQFAPSLPATPDARPA